MKEVAESTTTATTATNCFQDVVFVVHVVVRNPHAQAD